MKRVAALLVPLGLLASLFVPAVRALLSDALAALITTFWMAYILVSRLPQVVPWAVLLLVALVVSARSLSRGERRVSRGNLEQVFPEGRIEGWTRLLEQAAVSPYTDWRLSQRLGNLTAEVLAQQHRLESKEAKEALKSGAFDLSESFGESAGESMGEGVGESIESYLQRGMTRFSRVAIPDHRGRGWRRRPKAHRTGPDRVVRYLEAQLLGVSEPVKDKSGSHDGE